MQEITVGVDGMMCGMCESHVNDAVRAAFPTVKKVSSSHGAGKTVIVIEEDIPDEKIVLHGNCTKKYPSPVSRENPMRKKASSPA